MKLHFIALLFCYFFKGLRILNIECRYFTNFMSRILTCVLIVGKSKVFFLYKYILRALKIKKSYF